MEAAFRGELEFLSNFYPAAIVMDEITFQSSEHLYHYLKMATNEGRNAILNASTPLAAKRLSRKFPLRDDWEEVKLDVMRKVVRLKFTQHPELMAKLKNVTGEIIEENYWGDVFWGVCNGVGENHLGKILMEIRDKGTGSGMPKRMNEKRKGMQR